jgi:hypothetical protein
LKRIRRIHALCKREYRIDGCPDDGSGIATAGFHIDEHRHQVDVIRRHRHEHCVAEALREIFVLDAGVECVAEDGSEAEDARTDAARAISLLRDGGQPETLSINFGRAYLTLGRVLQAQGKLADARAAFRSAADHLRSALGSDNPDARSAEEQANGHEHP